MNRLENKRGSFCQLRMTQVKFLKVSVGRLNSFYLFRFITLYRRAGRQEIKAN